jgi:serine/threonine protein kinase
MITSVQPHWSEIKANLENSKEDIIGGVPTVTLLKVADTLKNHWNEIALLTMRSWSVLHLRPKDVKWHLPLAIEVEGNNIIVLSKEVLDHPSESNTIRLAAHLNKQIPLIHKTIRYEPEYMEQFARREACINFQLQGKPEFVHFYHSCEYTAHLKKSAHVVRKMGITLEYCNGKDLLKVNRELLNNKDNLLSLVRNMCEILNRLALEELLHRDIRPENLFIINTDGKLTMKLGDFGFAGKRQEEQRRLQKNGENSGGTIDYLAPEVLFAKDKKDDPEEGSRMIDLLCSLKTDVWSMGIVLYEMIIGDLPPFAGTIELEQDERMNTYSQNTINSFLYDLLIPENCLDVIREDVTLREFLFKMIRQMLVIHLNRRVSGPDLLKGFNDFVSPLRH